MKARLVIFFIIISSAFTALFAQNIHVEHIGNLYNQNVSLFDLLSYDVQLLDSDQENVYVTLRVDDSRNGQVVLLKSQLISLRRGSNMLANYFKNNTNQFSVFNSNLASGSTSLNTMTFSQGQFSFCLEISNQEEFVLADKCLQFSIENNSELLLITPFDEEVLVTDNPVFTWTRILKHVGSNLEYRIKIVESEEQMDPAIALVSKQIFFTQNSLRNNILVYNNSFPKMDESNYYYWQIEAFSNNRLIAISDVWEYRFEDRKKMIANSGNFVLLTNRNQTHYFKGDELNIRLVNTYDKKTFKYKIVDSQGQEVLLSGAELVDVEHRGNNHVIDLENKILKNKIYTLVIVGHKSDYSLKFINIL